MVHYTPAYEKQYFIHPKNKDTLPNKQTGRAFFTKKKHIYRKIYIGKGG